MRAELGARRAQILAPHRNVGEQIAHDDARPRRAGSGTARRSPRRARRSPSRPRPRRRARRSSAGDRRDRRQALRRESPACRRCVSPDRRHRQLRGRVTPQRERAPRRAGSRCRRRRPRSRQARRRERAPRCAVAPASSAFSTSSFTTESGRSMTSPAAICPIVAGSRSRIKRRLRFERRAARSIARRDLARARDHARRQAGHARDFDPERARRTARQHAVREDRRAPRAVFSTAVTWKLATSGQRSASATSSWKCVAKSTIGACVLELEQIFADRLRDREPVDRARAAADFVDEQANCAASQRRRMFDASAIST
jgi:hypothetical protein